MNMRFLTHITLQCKSLYIMADRLGNKWLIYNKTCMKMLIIGKKLKSSLDHVCWTILSISPRLTFHQHLNHIGDWHLDWHLANTKVTLDHPSSVGWWLAELQRTYMYQLTFMACLQKFVDCQPTANRDVIQRSTKYWWRCWSSVDQDVYGMSIKGQPKVWIDTQPEMHFIQIIHLLLIRLTW